MENNFVEQRSPTVLVVDDDSSMRMLLRLALEQEGYQVVEAADGEACLAAYNQHQPDAILLDAVMPGMDGFTCCRKLRTLASSELLPIVTITVLDDPDSIERAFEMGATDYITKPIHWTLLRHRLRRLIQQYLQARQVESLLQQLASANQEVERLARELARHQAKTQE